MQDPAMQDPTKPRPARRRSNRDRTDATRAALLAAARTLFVAKGYADTATPEIVAAANVTRGALYHHFADKAALFRAVAMDEAHAVAAQITRDSSAAEDGLAAGTEAYFAAMTVPGRARLLLVDGPAVLTAEEIDEINRIAGAEELRDGLSAMAPDLAPDVLDALTDALSAAFDRGALAVARGAPAEPYRQAMQRLLSGLISPESRREPA